jgi:thioredoxin
MLGGFSLKIVKPGSSFLWQNQSIIFRLETVIVTVKKQFSSFQEMLSQASRPILVDFYATWCGPCQVMAPILEEVGSSLRDRVQIIKIDSDKYPHLASQYHIQALPTLVLFRNGQPIHRIEGVMQASQLIQQLQMFV